MNNDATELLQRLLDAMNAHDPDAVVSLMADEVSFWEPTYPEPRIGRDFVRQEMAGFFAMLPDIQFQFETVAGEADAVMCEFSYAATYEGRAVRLRECSVSRLDGEGRFAEVRVYFDRLTLLRQLGMPAE